MKALQEKCGADQLQIEENNLEKEVIQLAAETQVLKKSAPEANDDSNIQYFLAIAELEKGNAILRQQEIICNDNLKSLDENLEGTQKDLQEIKGMSQVLKDNNPIALEKNKVCTYLLIF